MTLYSPMVSSSSALFLCHSPPPPLFYYYTLCDSSPGLAGRATSSPGWCYHRGWAADSGPPCWQEWQPPSWGGCERSDLSARSRSQQWRQCGSLLLSELLHLSQVGWKRNRERRWLSYRNSMSCQPGNSWGWDQATKKKDMHTHQWQHTLQVRFDKQYHQRGSHWEKVMPWFPQ